MKIALVLGIAFAYAFFTVFTMDIEGDIHNITSSNASFNIDEFKKANPQMILSNNTKKMMEMKCECGVFDTELPAADAIPILTHSAFKVVCDCENSGKENCRSLCASFANATRDHGPELLCSVLGNYTNLTASVHSRICGKSHWIYTGMFLVPAICCEEHKVMPCDFKENNDTMNEL